MKWQIKQIEHGKWLLKINRVFIGWQDKIRFSRKVIEPIKIFFEEVLIKKDVKSILV